MAGSTCRRAAAGPDRPGSAMTASLMSSDTYFGEPLDDDALLTSLPREADSTPVPQSKVSAEAHNPSARPVWLDGAVSAAAQTGQLAPSVPGPRSRPKRGMDCSPFAGLSKKPFKRRAFEPILEEPAKQEPCPTQKIEASVLSSEVSSDTVHTGNLQSRLPSIPSVVTTNTFMQISISPQIWRAREDTKLMMNVGLQGIQLNGQHDLQLYLWSTLNPRIVTTGIPRPASCGDMLERTTSNASVEKSEDESGSAGRMRSAQSQDYGIASPVPVKKVCEGLLLDEVFLVRRDPQRRIPDEVFHTKGPFKSSTVLRLPDWPGDIWRFDLCCKVDIGTEEVVWVKSLDKMMQP